MMKVALSAMLICASTLMGGCAGHHSLPPTNFTSTSAPDDRIVKVAFDQYGAIYPDADEAGLPLPPTNVAGQKNFGLRRYYAGLGQTYDPAPIRQKLAATIRAAMNRHRADRLVILIKGYDNSFESYDDGFDFLRQRIDTMAPDPARVVLQVYWDGYTSGTGAKPLAPTWFRTAIGSSNLAGQCGLRPLLALLPVGTNITFVTHSRGAAVALTVATDPPEEDRRRADRCDPVPPAPVTLGDVALIAFAPAVGDGLVRKEKVVPDDLFATFDRIYIGFNHSDKYTSKTFLGVRLGGKVVADTRLASDVKYRDLVEQGSGGRIAHENYTQKRHAIGAYLASEPQSLCLFWAGRLLAKEPAGCRVRR